MEELEWRALMEAWIPRGSDVALVDVPVHRNVGDLFILAVVSWWLDELGCRVVYRAGVRDYRTTAARRALTSRTILIGLGGGNFGDLYPPYQRLREQVARDFPAHRFVILPQSIHFGDPRALDRAIRTFRRHPDLYLAVRDAPSLDVARRFTPHVALLPDVVDALGASALRTLERRHPARVQNPLPFSVDGTLHLLRRDTERATPDASVPAGPCVDWPELFPGFARRLAGTALVLPWLPLSLARRLHEAWVAVAESLLVSAVAEIRRTDHLVTDRLHGAIVARLAGRPFTIRDNSYRKLTTYAHAWWPGPVDPTGTTRIAPG